MQTHRRIGILNLDATIPMYQEALRYLASSLPGGRAEIVHLGCTGALERCININSRAEIAACREIDEIKAGICPECRVRQQDVRRDHSYAVSGEMDGLSPDQDLFLGNVDRVLEQDRRAVSILGLRYDNIDVCKIAFYDFSIAGKMSHLSSLNEEEIKRLTQHVRDALVLLNFFHRVAQRCSFDTVLYVNGNYSHNTLSRSALRERCREFLSVEFQFSNIKAWNRVFFERDRLELKPKWPTIASLETDYQLTRSDLRPALAIMENRYLGNDFNSYTKPGARAAYAQFDAFRSKYRTIISYFSCSTDEMYSHVVTHDTKIDERFYRNQHELIQDFISNARDDMGYVIRVHPRLAPNKRDRVVSREIAEISRFLEIARGKQNFFVVDAADPLSSYYLLLNSDLILVAWSTIALESMVAGKPAFALFPLDCCYPIDELCRQPKDTDEFRAVVRGEVPVSSYRVDDVKLMRWISMVYNALSVAIPSPRGGKRTLLPRVYNAFYSRVVSKRSLYSFFMTSIKLFSSKAAEWVLTGERPQKAFRPHNGTAECLKELERFRRKVRQLIVG